MQIICEFAEEEGKGGCKHFLAPTDGVGEETLSNPNTCGQEKKQQREKI